MKIKQIAALVLILYAAIFVAFAFHNHFSEQPGKHCNVCQTLHSPGFAPGITAYSPVLTVQWTLPSDVGFVNSRILITSSSERAPPTL